MTIFITDFKHRKLEIFEALGNFLVMVSRVGAVWIEILVNCFTGGI